MNPILWKPTQNQIDISQIEDFRKQVNARFNINLKDYYALHDWSVSNIADFWKAIWGFMANIPETIIAMLATTSIGAIWSSSSPDFGVKRLLDRFTQIEPKVIFASNGYFYKGNRFNSIIRTL